MIKKVVIYGAGNAGKHLYSESKKIKELNVIAFIDNKIEGLIDNIPIYDSKHFWNKQESIDEVYITAGGQKTLRFMIEDCRENVPNADLYIIYDIAGKNKLELTQDAHWNERWVRKLFFSQEKPSLHYFEVPITDNCNLNCKGCLFASNLSVCDRKSQDVPLESLKNDAKRMSELFYDVPWIRILGGEPLMHPDIIQILEYYRQCFPCSEIDLCTNGLLIPKMEDNFWACIKKNRISIHVSGYKPVYKMLNRIDAILKEHAIEYVILKRDRFFKYYTESDIHDMNWNFDNCIASGCYEVYRGNIFTCSAVIAFQRFNNSLNMNYILTEGKDYFALNSEADAFKIKQKLESPSNVCKYCDVKNSQSFEWKYSGTELVKEDFLL